jgi:hypothetical protein
MQDNQGALEEGKLQQSFRLTALGFASLVPYLGGPLGVALGEFFERTATRRIRALFDDVFARLATLESFENSLTSGSLSDAESFMTVLLDALKTCERTTSASKFEALRNAILNSWVSTEPVDLQLIFIRYVEELTPSHLQLLKLLKDPRGFFMKNGIDWPNIDMGSKKQLVAAAMPSWAPEFTNQLSVDLQQRGIVGNSSLGAITTAASLATPSTTKYGADFLTFISEPELA